MKTRTVTRDIIQKPGVAAALLGILSFTVYRLTLAPGVGFIDSGELATVAATLGVAHPTGYPLFTLLGWVFAHLPVAGEVIVRLNTMAAVFCALGVVAFFSTASRVLAAGVAEGEGNTGRTVPAAGAAAILAFSETYWTQAVNVEVYSLHLLLVCVILLTFFRANMPMPGEVASEGRWYAFAFVTGLSFTNHMTTLLLAPGLLYLYFARQGGGPAPWRRIIRMAPPFVAGLSLYLYVPLRAAHSPLLNWGYAATPERFWWHWTGKQYRVWIFSSTEAAGRQFLSFLSALPSEFTAAGLALAMLGIPLLFRSNRRMTAGLLLLVAGCIAYAINYDIQDIEPYFILAFIGLALFAAVGLHAVHRWILARVAQGRRVAALLVAVLGLLPLVANLSRVDERGNHLVDDYTSNMFASLEQNAVIFSYQWDYWVSASYYHQHVTGERPDVTVIDKELLRRSWYLRQLEKNVPWLIASSQQAVDAFLKEVDRFEHDLPYNGAVIEARYAAMISSFIAQCIATRPVYVTGEIEPGYTPGYRRLPAGLCFRLSTEPGFIPMALPAFTYRAFPRRGRLEDMTRRLYAEAFAHRGEYYLLAGKDTLEARKSLENGLTFDPAAPTLRRLAGMLQPR